MSYCINPYCQKRENSNKVQVCENCQTPLLINNRYKLIKRLSKNANTCTEVFEVEDSYRKGTRKILKAIHNDGIKLEDNTELFERLVTLFEREINVLKNLPHPHIPRGEDSFQFTLNDGKELYCLVMEKILGQDLEQWLKTHGAIQERQALNWLQQLSETLSFMHEHEWFHRDIKPSNIIRQPDGTLFLIDFGTVRQITATVIKGGERTSIYSQGYTPPEQRKRQAVPESDFYALGRTFVHLLTGKHPDDITPDISQWSKNTRHRICDSLVTLINDLMMDTPNNRPPNAQAILARLNQIQNEINSREQTQRQQWRRWLIRCVTVLPVFLGALLAIHLLRSRTDELERGDHLSYGEEVLANISAFPEKDKGVLQVKDGKYDKAVELLNTAWEKSRTGNNKSDPETLIYLNNARINNQKTSNPKDKVYTIAVVAPVSDNIPDKQIFNQGLELLRGVAQAQDEAIKKGINLKVLIADDYNKNDQAKQIAEKLVKKTDILAVVGHFSSDCTKVALPIYENSGLVLVSPSSTSVSLSSKSKFFFRTVPSDEIAAQRLAKHLDEDLNKKAKKKKVAILWTTSSDYSISLKDQFNEFWHRFYSGEVVRDSEEFHLSDNNLKASDALDKAKKQGATAIALFPGGIAADSVDNALETIKSNTNPDLTMVAGDSLYIERVLTEAGEKAVSSHLVIPIPWHRLSSPNPDFPKSAEGFWKTKDVSWRTAATYDATWVLIKAIKTQPSRDGIQKVLSNNTFQNQFREVRGATGDIKFEGSDRANAKSTLVTVVPKCSPPSEYSFVPVDYKPKNKPQNKPQNCL